MRKAIAEKKTTQKTNIKIIVKGYLEQNLRKEKKYYRKKEKTQIMQSIPVVFSWSLKMETYNHLVLSTQ